MITPYLTETLGKYFSSILFRIIIIFYGTFLFLIQENVVSIIYYILLVIVYIFFYLLLLSKEQPLLRTINDYLFITLVLLYKDLSLIYNICFILFPIINSPNHTHNRRQPYLLFLFSCLTYFLLRFFSEIDFCKNDILVVICFFTFSTINYFEYARSKLIDKLLKIYLEIDKQLSKKSKTSQLPDIYNLVIEKMRKEFKLGINSIINFQKYRDELIVRNSSFFVHTYNIDEVVKKLENKTFDMYSSIILNDVNYINVISIKVEKFIFIIILDEETNNKNLFEKLKIFDILTPIFNKLPNIIELENTLNDEKNKVLSELNKKSHYVNTILKSTHYLRNQFSSITTYFQLVNKLENIKPEDSHKILQLEYLIKDEKAKAKVSTENIINKAFKVLDKEENPFIPKSKKNERIKYIFMTIKNIWIQSLSERDIIIKNFDDNFNKKINTDINTLEYIFTDLIENIRKYNNGKSFIEFEYNEYLIVRVVNDVKDFKKNKQNLMELVKSFNNDDKLEINKKNGFGLPHVKELANYINLLINLNINENNMFVVELEFRS